MNFEQKKIGVEDGVADSNLFQWKLVSTIGGLGGEGGSGSDCLGQGREHGG